MMSILYFREIDEAFFLVLEYLEHAPCMRKAQTEYEGCADEYQLRIKTLNKVAFENLEKLFRSTPKNKIPEQSSI